MDEKELEEVKEETRDVETLDEEIETEIDPKIEGRKIPVGFIIFAGVLVVAIIAVIITLIVLGGPLSKAELDTINSTGSI